MADSGSQKQSAATKINNNSDSTEKVRQGHRRIVQFFITPANYLFRAGRRIVSWHFARAPTVAMCLAAGAFHERCVKPDAVRAFA